MNNEKPLSLLLINPILEFPESISDPENNLNEEENNLPEILFITSYPPRECGIATYSQDLILALNTKFSNSFHISICALESENEQHNYLNQAPYILNTDYTNAYDKLVLEINNNPKIQMVVIQHEFGFFSKHENQFKQFLDHLIKPVIVVFHTVLPNPDHSLLVRVKQIAHMAESIIVMTQASVKLLIDDYSIPAAKISIIPHGTHLVPHSEKEILKKKHHLSGKRILSTFGLLSSGKNIETTLNALPAIVKSNPDVCFLIIGKTHPTVLKNEGEQYRNLMWNMVVELNLQPYVKFINQFLPLEVLLEYLQLTDIYLFTSNDPNQAVSGTFSYAISCGCPVISTPIPHAREVLRNGAGIIVDFKSPDQLATSAIHLLNNEALRNEIGSQALHQMASTAWENSAIAHARLFEKTNTQNVQLIFNLPEINLSHIKKMTTDFGILQFSIINRPDIDSGYTLDDNARALIAFCQHFELTKNKEDLKYIKIYLDFIEFCMQSNGYFLNYVDKTKVFTHQNNQTNLADSNGRAVWALGHLISIEALLPESMGKQAESIIKTVLLNINNIHSTRAMAFMIKGLYYKNLVRSSENDILIIRNLANRLTQMFRHESVEEWQWFESYLTYANSILPEAMLCAWNCTGDANYKEIAIASFDFLLSKTFNNNTMQVISNKCWLKKGETFSEIPLGGEQPIDVAYTIITLKKFYDALNLPEYRHKIDIAMNWFLGNNQLHQIIYNPCTGGCYDGLEENYVNLNQGAESTVSYLMARLAIEKLNQPDFKEITFEHDHMQLNMYSL